MSKIPESVSHSDIWGRLESHSDEMKLPEKHMRNLFENDGERFKKFSITYEVSKIIIINKIEKCNIIISFLFEIEYAFGLFKKYNRGEDHEIIDGTSQRSQGE